MKNNKIIAIFSFIILCFTSSCTKGNSSSSGNPTTPSIVVVGLQIGRAHV